MAATRVGGLRLGLGLGLVLGLVLVAAADPTDEDSLEDKDNKEMASEPRSPAVGPVGPFGAPRLPWAMQHEPRQENPMPIPNLEHSMPKSEHPMALPKPKAMLIAPENRRKLAPTRWAQEVPHEFMVSNDKRGVAFRDAVLETIVQRAVERVVERITEGTFPIRNVMTMKDTEFQQKEKMFEVKGKINNAKISGIGGLKLSYLRVIRHFGLRDIKVDIKVETDIAINGKYEVNGKAAGFLPLTGSGDFDVALTRASVSAIILVTIDKSPENPEDITNLVLQDPKMAIQYEDVKFNFEHLMGGGAMGSLANLVINAMGEAIINEKKKQAITMIKNLFKQRISHHV